jgi:hypothetical protein
MAAGISWRSTIRAPITTKIQSATPASFRLIVLAKAGVAIKPINPTIDIVHQVLLIFHSPFLPNQALLTHLTCQNEKKITFYSKSLI